MADVSLSVENFKPDASPCGLVVLRCAEGLCLAKTIQPDGTLLPYQNARLFDAAELPLVDLPSLYDVLADAVGQPRLCVVRGSLIAAPRASGIRRLAYDDRETGDLATLRDVPRRWLALDLDGLDLPPGCDVRDIRACAHAVLPRLPAAFQTAECVVQATSSHGLKPGARLRLWYWLARPITCKEAKLWLQRESAPVDMSLFQPQAVVYTASPILPCGYRDHLPQRVTVLPGKPRVAVPDAAALAPAPRPPRDPLDFAKPMHLGQLAGILRRVREASKGERHNVVFWAGCRLGEAVERGDMDATTAEELLTETIAFYGLGEAEHAAAVATIRSGVAKGRDEWLAEMETV